MKRRQGSADAPIHEGNRIARTIAEEAVSEPPQLLPVVIVNGICSDKCNSLTLKVVDDAVIVQP